MRIILATGLVTLTACGNNAPTNDVVRAEFEHLKPAAEVLAIDAAQSDPDNIYFKIRFRTPPDTTLRGEGWLYQHFGHGAWQVTTRDSSLKTH